MGLVNRIKKIPIFIRTITEYDTGPENTRILSGLEPVVRIKLTSKMGHCIFCNTTKTSKEHLWGAWWRDFYPPTHETKLLRDLHTVTIHSERGVPIASKGQFSNVGHPLSATTKVVCINCNNTWMSIIEENMKITFEILFINKKEYISTDVASYLKKWIFLKFCLLDRAYSDKGVFFPNDLEKSIQIKKQIDLKRNQRWGEFNEGKLIPDQFRFFIARSYPYNNKIGSFNHIPLHKIIFDEDVMKVFFNDTCLFFNGLFIGIITDHDDLITLLRMKINDKTLNIVELLTSKEQILPANNEINGKELENLVLSELEKEIEYRLRRNFSA